MNHEEASTPYTGNVPLKFVQEFIGYIAYISQNRPDIIFITNYLQIHLHRFDQHYLKIAGILLSYLFHNLIKKFTYTIDKTIDNCIKVYTDSNHGGDFTGFSNGCIMIEIFGLLVLGKTSLNRIISFSSTHAEIYTINKNHEMIDSIIALVNEIMIIVHHPKMLLNPSIYIDNQAVINILENVTRFKNKFQDIHIAKFRQKIVEGNYGLYHIDTKMNKADIGTKPLPKASFCHLLNLIGDSSQNTNLE